MAGVRALPAILGPVNSSAGDGGGFVKRTKMPLELANPPPTDFPLQGARNVCSAAHTAKLTEKESQIAMSERETDCVKSRPIFKF